MHMVHTSQKSLSYQPQVSLGVQHHGQIFLRHDRWQQGEDEPDKYRVRVRRGNLWLSSACVSVKVQTAAGACPFLIAGLVPQQTIWLDKVPRHSPLCGGERDPANTLNCTQMTCNSYCCSILLWNTCTVRCYWLYVSTEPVWSICRDVNIMKTL